MTTGRYYHGNMKIHPTITMVMRYHYDNRKMSSQRNHDSKKMSPHSHRGNNMSPWQREDVVMTTKGNS